MQHMIPRTVYKATSRVSLAPTNRAFSSSRSNQPELIRYTSLSSTANTPTRFFTSNATPSSGKGNQYSTQVASSVEHTSHPPPPLNFPVPTMSVKSLVEDAIVQNKVVIFSKSHCPYCRRAKALFASEYPTVEAKVYELDQLEDGAQIQGYLLSKTGQRTVPNIFINQTHIGGSSDAVSKQQSGELAKLIAV